MTEKQECFSWDFPRIGTCGEPCDILRISISRVRAIPDLMLKFDGVRGGWVIGGSFYTPDGNDFEFKEIGFIPESDIDEDRFVNEDVKKEHRK